MRSVDDAASELVKTLVLCYISRFVSARRGTKYRGVVMYNGSSIASTTMPRYSDLLLARDIALDKTIPP